MELTVVAIAYQNGTVGRMQIFKEDATDDKIEAEIQKQIETWAALDLVAVAWHRCTLDDFPVNQHDKRDAWTIEDGKIIVKETK